jgi:hypothetical protein
MKIKRVAFREPVQFAKAARNFLVPTSDISLTYIDNAIIAESKRLEASTLIPIHVVQSIDYEPEPKKRSAK